MRRTLGAFRSRRRRGRSSESDVADNWCIGEINSFYVSSENKYEDSESRFIPEYLIDGPSRATRKNARLVSKRSPGTLDNKHYVRRGRERLFGSEPREGTLRSNAA